MAQNETEIRYLTPPTVEVKKKKYCRFKKNRIRYIDYKDPEFLKKFLNNRHISEISEKSGKGCQESTSYCPSSLCY